MKKLLICSAVIAAGALLVKYLIDKNEISVEVEVSDDRKAKEPAAEAEAVEAVETAETAEPEKIVQN